jgi:broad specificity phosphatase PhoE
LNTLYVIRHGECVHNVEGWIAGQNDSPLTALGREQARANGRLLREIAGDLSQFDFFASSLHRTCVTMELAREAAGLAPTEYRADRRLMEIDFGDDTGKTHAEIDAGLGRFGAQNWDYVRPNGESLAMVHARVVAFLGTLTRDAALVTHAGPLRLIRAHLLGLSHEAALAYHPPNAGIMRLSVGAETYFGE